MSQSSTLAIEPRHYLYIYTYLTKIMNDEISTMKKKEKKNSV